MNKLPNLPSMKPSVSTPVADPTPEPVTETASKYVAQRTFSMKGVPYTNGDPIDVSGLSDHKLGQLLNQRWIRPSSTN